jgi:acetate kinase
MTGDVLVINSGSSSVKSAVFAADDAPRLRVRVEALHTAHPRVIVDDRVVSGGAARPPQDHRQAVRLILELIRGAGPIEAIAGIGHRVVHGGVHFDRSTVITPDVRDKIHSLLPLAPLHLPANLAGIDALAEILPDIPQVACFDTAFHRGRSFSREAFALPRRFFEAGLRRYGFHGLSYEFIARQLRRIVPEIADKRVVVAHLGNGASLCGLDRGRSVDTTMSLTALDGLPMGTRCGGIDPGAVLYLLEQEGMSPRLVNELLYHHSGLLGISGIASDMRELLASPDPHAAQAVDYFVDHVTTAIGAMAATLGGFDALVFTAGIGERSAVIRERICRRLEWLGIELDDDANRTNGPRLSKQSARCAVWVIPTDEELMIAGHVRTTLRA